MVKNDMKFKKNKQKMRKIIKMKNIFSIDFSFFFIFLIAYLIGEIKFYAIYILFLIFHELSHFFVAKKLGYFPKKIKLNFFGAVLEGDDDFSLKDEIKIVISGPLFNFFVIIFCYLCFWFEPETYDFLYDILVANWALFLFNCLPIFPLDFGRFILLYLSLKKDRVTAVKYARNFSFIFVILLFVFYLVSCFYSINFSLGCSAMNLMILILSNGEDTSYKRQLFVNRKFRLLSKGFLERTIYVDGESSLYSLFKFIDDNHFLKFVFLNKDLQIVDSMTEIDVYKKLKLL